MPHKSSNIPSNMFYSSVGAETLRIARAINSANPFFNSVKPLQSRMLNKGAEKQILFNVLCKFYNRHQVHFNNIAIKSPELLSLIFS